MIRRNSKKERVKKGSPAWMVTYGDMMTLLLVFFVLLYSFSVMDLEKFEGFISALKAHLGVLDAGQTISQQSRITQGLQGESYNPSHLTLTRVMGELGQFIKEQDLQEEISMKIIERRGLVIRVTGQVLYELGKSTIKPEGMIILSKIADSIRDIPNDIMVEGHTDNWPINNQEFPSNWELSTTRATNVIKYFIEKHQIPPDRLSAAGYSQYRPLYNNDTAEHRAKNRRVEIVILNTIYEQGEQDGG